MPLPSTVKTIPKTIIVAKITSWPPSPTDTQIPSAKLVKDSLDAKGTVSSVATGTGLTGGPITTSGTISLADTAVTPGAYTSANITVDAQGRITAAANGTGGAGGTDPKTLNSASLVGPGNLDFGTVIAALTAKPTPVDADALGLMDSAASNALKKLTWADIKTTLKAYLDTLYLSTIAMSNLPAAVKAYPLHIAWIGQPSASQVISLAVFTQAVNFPSGVSGSAGRVLTTNPASSYTINITIYNSSDVSQATGSVVIGTGGAFTFNWTSGYTTSAGDYIKFVGQSSADAALKDFAFTFLGAAT